MSENQKSTISSRSQFSILSGYQAIRIKASNMGCDKRFLSLVMIKFSDENNCSLVDVWTRWVTAMRINVQNSEHVSAYAGSVKKAAANTSNGTSGKGRPGVGMALPAWAYAKEVLWGSESMGAPDADLVCLSAVRNNWCSNDDALPPAWISSYWKGAVLAIHYPVGIIVPGKKKSARFWFR